MTYVPTQPRTAAECIIQTAGFERLRVHDVRELAILSGLRSKIVLHGPQVALAQHDAKRTVRKRHHDLAVQDIASSQIEHAVAVVREAMAASSPKGGW